jgi:hypothetical protein
MEPADDTREDLGGGVGGQTFYGVGRGADVPVGEPRVAGRTEDHSDADLAGGDDLELPGPLGLVQPP